MAMSVREPESRVHAVAAHLQILPPPARSRAGHLQWINDNWSVVEPAMMELANQENPGTVRSGLPEKILLNNLSLFDPI
jgi:hypothetical protein